MLKFKLIEHNDDLQQKYAGYEDTRKFLVEGATYEGTKESHDWHTKIWIAGHCFNSVCFEELTTQEKGN